ncbi:cutA, cutinase A [Gymnopilus junonius]|uniref:Cutinase n=1 Tax=Gymnopilus junonius TaxID=109634 RepID=A0A9P5P1Q6_GYMJU|nr:cutA, cutinase A [Gymnopilus junonius]
MFGAALTLVLATISAFAAPTARQSCADVTVIFARGTTELPPIGTIVGPPFELALQSTMGSKTLSFQGVDYAATIAGFLEGGDPQGAANMAQDVISTANSCPDTKIVMSGYSQGGQLVHLAVPQLSSAVQQRVNAIVIFGDPDNGEPFPGNLNSVEKTFCAEGDDICAHGDLVLPPHLSYGADAPAAASFVMSTIF